MSSSSRWPQHHRRRSHSASSLKASCNIDSQKYRSVLKRARSRASGFPSYNDIETRQPPQKWDVDIWRRCKKPRRGSYSPPSSHNAPSLFSPGPAFHDQEDSTIFVDFPATLPSTSAAFHFFPERPKRSPRSSNSSSHIPRAASLSQVDIPTDHGLDQLRLDAFGELHRSIAESGEGLVSRMRELENSRSRSPSSRFRPERTRGRKPSLFNVESTWTLDKIEDSDDDDIQIISGDNSCILPSDEVSSFGLSQKKRAFSMREMDIDHPMLDPLLAFTPESSERSSSPIDATFSSVSGYSSEDDNSGVFQEKYPTSIFTSGTIDANSSSVSLAPPPSTPPSEISPPTSSCRYISPGVFHIPSTASKEERALAALTLALANGAGGLSDYADLVNTQSHPQNAMDESLVGEMWH